VCCVCVSGEALYARSEHIVSVRGKLKTLT
jgi:hypothetical protein